MQWAVTSDYDCDWCKTKKDALKRASEFKDCGASYCFIQKFNEEEPVGECIYIFQ